MRMSFACLGVVTAAGLLMAGNVLFADGLRFSDFTPLTSSAGPTADEAAPITFGNSAFQQRSLADRNTQLAARYPNTGVWDMITVNETGPHKSRYLFTVFESFQSGVQRHDLLSGVTDTIWHSLNLGDEVRFDACYWTPWGTLITGEEEWSTLGDEEHPIPYGRLFELTNPIEAPPVFTPADAGQQRERGLLPSQHRAADVTRRYSVRQSRQHVLHRRAERRKPLPVHLGRKPR